MLVQLYSVHGTPTRGANSVSDHDTVGGPGGYLPLGGYLGLLQTNQLDWKRHAIVVFQSI